MIRVTFLGIVAACLTLLSTTSAEAQFTPYGIAPYYGSSGFWDNDYNPYGAVYGRGIRKQRPRRANRSYRPYYGNYYSDRWYR